jgi:DNA-directed RNA polymerase subunit RPC12/RpoP
MPEYRTCTRCGEDILLSDERIAALDYYGIGIEDYTCAQCFSRILLRNTRN